MPPPPTAVILLSVLRFLTILTPIHSCSAAPPFHPCPPFTSPPPYPFSTTPGCGHPSFQFHCLNRPRATLSINNLTFSLLQFHPNSTAVTLSPAPTPHSGNCTSLSISTFNRPISFSDSPFRVSDSSCSRLSILKPCPPPNLPNCSHCPFECKLIKNPLHLLHECDRVSATRHRNDFEPACQGDILGVLDNILRMGFEVEWDEDLDPYFSNCKSCKANNNGICGYNSSDSKKQFICFPSQSRIKQQSPHRNVLLSIIVLFVCILIALSITVVIFRSRRKKLTDTDEDPFIFLRRHRSASLLPPVFTYDELDYSTNRFDPKRKIGGGGFGSVYLGQLSDGRLVAVKHLHKHIPGAAAGEKGFSKKSFCNEILILSSINHPNLVKLNGYCSDPRGLLLVYDYVPNGTVSDHLHGNASSKGSLKWSTRLEIALQTAMAIEYLHFSVLPPIVHRDITSPNIFVEKDMRVKVGDFGLSRLLVCSETTLSSSNISEGVWTGPQGTPGYLDPDYYSSFRLNEKSDIYSFGVVLLELITGMRAVDHTRAKREMTLVDMVVPRIQMGLLHEVVDRVLVVDGEAVEGVAAVAELAFQCVAADKDDRPDAREVVAELRRIKGCRRGGGGGGVLRGSNSRDLVMV